MLLYIERTLASKGVHITHQIFCFFRPLDLGTHDFGTHDFGTNDFATHDRGEQEKWRNVIFQMLNSKI